MKLQSIDYARLVQYAAQKQHMTMLNKTQVNKILFYVYGVYLAKTGRVLFDDDDSPKAWTYGPVFPRPNKVVDTKELIKGFSPEQVAAFRENKEAMDLVISAVANMYNKSAISLTKWSHVEGSPWYNTIYKKDDSGNIVGQNPWNTRITDDMIHDYFSKPENRIFGDVEGNRQ